MRIRLVVERRVLVPHSKFTTNVLQKREATEEHRDTVGRCASAERDRAMRTKAISSR